MNDPFELWAFKPERPKDRQFLEKCRRYVDFRSRCVCLSRSNVDNLLWSHYGDGHRGICLGFDIPDEYAREVVYTNERFSLPSNDHLQRGELGDEFVDRLLATKQGCWRYEQEVRLPVQPDEEEGNIQFCKFDNNLQLREVIAGCRCVISRKEIEAALRGYRAPISVVKASQSLRGFDVVVDEGAEKDW